MDYEKKYKEAVGILEFLIGLETVQESGTIPVKDIINTFPELKSHNDERIRKSLISVFTTHKKDEMYYGTSVDEILEWLDRQGEQKPYGQRKECTDCQFNYAGECKGFCAMKRGEQKPAEVRTTGYWNVQDIEQKPAWSEEDKRIIDNLISQLGNLYARKLIKEETKDKYVNWLKPLKDRVPPQSHWKPSDKQLEALEHSLGDYNIKIFEDRYEILKSLYQDLKKLMDEQL